MFKHKIVTPIRDFPFSKNENQYYNKLTDSQAIDLYLKKKENTGFIDPHLFTVLVDRGLLFRGETEDDLANRYKKLKDKE